MTLIIQKPTGAKLVFAKDFSFDPDAAAYIAAVEAADTQALETNTRYAINNFVIGCKQDGIWSAIKASCILAGARTLTGALVPLVGSAPTNVDNLFVTANYDRKTGLISDGTKKLNLNRNNDQEGDSKHFSVFPTTLPGARSLIEVENYSTGGNTTYTSSQGGRYQINAAASTAAFSGLPVVNTLLGVSRTSSTSTFIRTNKTTTFISSTSTAPASGNYLLYSSNWNARLAFYSIGESLDLALLDARVTALINAFAAAIP
jgi:hypothetical protein